MDRRPSLLNDKTAGRRENRMTSHQLLPLISALIVLILGLISLVLT